MLFAFYLVANARVFCEAVLYHGSLRFLAMNPAVLVILWIRLSVTFGYPATLRDIQTISKIFGDTQVSKGIIDTFDQSLPQPATYTSPFNLIIRRIRGDDDDESSTSTSPAADDTPTLPPPQHQRIISIVRVSSTSVVKPKVIVNKSNEISVSVKSKHANNNNKTLVDKFESYVTPFVSLLRKNRLDVDEDVPKIATSSPSSLSVIDGRSSIAVVRQQSRNSVSSSITTSTTTSSTTIYDLHRESKSTFNDSSSDVDQDYVDDTTVRRIVLKKHTLGNRDALDESYDTQDDSSNDANDQEAAGAAPESALYNESEHSAEPERVYGEPERVYGEPEQVYGEPERVYGEPERVYGEPERTYGEPEKNYEESEKAYKPDDVVAEEPPENDFDKHDDSNDFKMPEGSSENPPPSSAPAQAQGQGPAPVPAPAPAKSYASYTTKLNDKKSSYIVDNGTYRKYRVEEKTPDGFIVGEYGMVSHQDGSLRGVRYTADSNINPSLIYETLVKFLSLK
ncbi:uncharacterized protein LOC135846566 [Planococcus citri]|uniref:uncharacterized protein LOC135846566 n=1 Tax=Planococcus citri TaxID=170843 RepID=UPI0031F95C10